MTQNLNLSKLLPRSLSSEFLNSILSNTVNKFTSEENSVLANGYIGSKKSTNLFPSSLNGRVNGINPGIEISSGNEKQFFTFKDLVDRMNVLGISTESMQHWMRETPSNLVAPITYDKFTNFSQYVWLGKALNSKKQINRLPVWNPDLNPEYYVIAKPPVTAELKEPVLLASTRNINLYINDRPQEKITVLFSSNMNFSVSSSLGTVTPSINILPSPIESFLNLTVFSEDIPDVAPSLDRPSLSNPLVSFTITTGNIPFAAGDYFEITINHNTGLYESNFISPLVNNKGTVSGVKTLSPSMLIDGVEIKPGNRILVKNQIDATENGIYVVSSYGKWQRDVNTTLEKHFPIQSKINVLEGVTNANKTFELISKFGGGADEALLTSSLIFSETPTTLESLFNDWQTFNFWVKRDAPIIKQLELDADLLISALRPIVEYDYDLQLNNFVTVDLPHKPYDQGLQWFQTKSAFNQTPLFDLFYYDGTHAQTVSSIFKYTEDSLSIYDEVLNFKPKLDNSGNYLMRFDIKKDEQFLFWKKKNELKCVFQEKQFIDKIVNIVSSNSTAPSVSFTNVSSLIQNELWSLVFLATNKFRLTGSLSGTIGEFNLSTTVNTFYFDLVFSNILGFNIGDSIKFESKNVYFPRFVVEEDSEIVNINADVTADNVDTGIWKTPYRMFKNLNNAFVSKISSADLKTHFNSVIDKQEDEDIFDPTLGGSIHVWDKQMPLLISLLIQPEISILGVIDYLKKQYNIALQHAEKFVNTNILDYLENNLLDVNDTVNMSVLYQLYEEIRAQDNLLKSIFGDTTSGISNWPASLSNLGLAQSCQPSITFDNDLGIMVIKHHDGHLSPLFSDSESSLLSSIRVRSDGTSSAAHISAHAPNSPYKKQLWFNTVNNVVYIFDVHYDSLTQPNDASIGQKWFNRALNITYEKNSSGWTTINTADQWVPFNLGTYKNNFILYIENILFANCMISNNVQYLYPNEKTLEEQFIKFANANNYDPYSPVFKPSDAFTWNYKASLGQASWTDVLKSHFDRPLLPSLPTCRPNLEPWKLLGHNVKPVSWDSNYAAGIITSITNTSVDYVKTTNVSPLAGTVMIDGIVIANGSKLLLVNQNTASTNGVWVVSAGAWIRSSDSISLQSGFTVTVGKLKGTNWVITSFGGNLDVDNIEITQSRMWKEQMWTDIKSTRPSLKLSVNIFTDELFPPYVNVSSPSAFEALTNIIPVNADSPYVFEDHGPIELVWRKSLDFVYDYSIASLKCNLLDYISKGWGNDFVKIGNSSYLTRDDISLFDCKASKLHGDKIESTHSANDLSFDSPLWNDDFAIKIICQPPSSLLNNFNVYVNDILVESFSTSLSSLTFTNITGTSVSITNLTINTKGKFFNTGDSFIILLKKDLVNTFQTNEDLVCEGCIHPDNTGATTETVITSYDPIVSFVPNLRKINLGLGQGFVNLLRYKSFNDASSSMNYFRNWSVKYHYAFEGLVRPDTVKLSTEDQLLPDTSYEIMLNRTNKISKLIFNGLRIQLVKYGEKELNADGLFIPKSDASDWQFRIEGFNAKNPKIKTIIHDTLGKFVSFTPLNNSRNRTWKMFTDEISTAEIFVPSIVTGLQNVINILFNYVSTLSNFEPIESAIDPETGRALTWQLEIEKLIDRVYGGMNVGEGHILNPFMSGFKIIHPVGILSKFSSNANDDYDFSQACFNTLGEVIDFSSLSILRNDEYSVVSSTNYPVLSASIFLDTYSHILVFNDTVQTKNSNLTIFNDFLGLNRESFYLTCLRNPLLNGKPTYDGLYLSSNGVFKQNISSSVDSISNYYDGYKTFLNADAAHHALSILGFTRKDYFKSLNVSESSEFNFWKSLIQSKGTNLSLEAITNLEVFSSLEVDELWAVKLAEYGDSRKKISLDFKINHTEVSQKFANYQFTNTNSTKIPQFNYVDNLDIFKWASIDDANQNFSFDSEEITESIVALSGEFPQYVLTKNIYEFSSIATSNPNLVPINSQTVKVMVPGYYTVTGNTWKNPTKFSPLKLITSSKDTIDIGLWHPAVGIHNLPAQSILDYIGIDDPAVYTDVINVDKDRTFNTSKPWTFDKIGFTFWNKANLDYIPYYDSKIFDNINARLNRWGKLTDWSTVDIWSWIESDVHPEKYAGAGKVANKKSYFRNRLIYRMPIAWSFVPAAVGDGHPAFGPANFTTIYVSSDNLIIDKGRASSLGLTTGKRFGAWNKIDNIPANECVLTNTISAFIGSETAILVPELGLTSNFSNKEILPLDTIGTKIGKIQLIKINATTVRAVDSSGMYEDIIISDWPAVLAPAATREFEFSKFGFIIRLTRNTLLALSSDQVADGLVNSNNIYIREAIKFTEIVPFPADSSILINDETDVNYNTTSFEWRSWPLPTQAQLDNDLVYPFNAWLPIEGKEQLVAASSDIVTEMQDAAYNLVLQSGTRIKYFRSEWSNWIDNEQTKTQKISSGTSFISFTQPDLDPNRVSVYINGSQLPVSSYNILSESVTLNTIYPEGHICTLIYRAYQPSAVELTFNPDVEDDFKKQVQYKENYSFSVASTKDSSGNKNTAKYYFWVSDLVEPVKNREFSLIKAKQLLTNHDDLFAVLYNLTENGRYDSVCISGLNRYVNNNNSKIRVMKDFTLRDDPEEMNLKNVHTEWSLIRRRQKQRIFNSLWSKLTDAVTGFTIYDRKIPDQIRIDYDEAFKTFTRFGFGEGQILADTELLRKTIKYIILNNLAPTKIGNIEISSKIRGLDYSNAEAWFDTPENARKTMQTIWTNASAAQINDIFFESLNDALVNNYEMTDIFKTSYITANTTLKN